MTLCAFMSLWWRIPGYHRGSGSNASLCQRMSRESITDGKTWTLPLTWKCLESSTTSYSAMDSPRYAEALPDTNLDLLYSVCLSFTISRNSWSVRASSSTTLSWCQWILIGNTWRNQSLVPHPPPTLMKSTGFSTWIRRLIKFLVFWSLWLARAVLRFSFVPFSWLGVAFLRFMGRCWFSAGEDQPSDHPVLPCGQHSGSQTCWRTQQWTRSLHWLDGQNQAAEENQDWFWWITLSFHVALF